MGTDTIYFDDNLSMTRGGNAYYYLADGLGSIRNVVSANETLQNTYDYYAFGNTLGTPDGPCMKALSYPTQRKLSVSCVIH